MKEALGEHSDPLVEGQPDAGDVDYSLLEKTQAEITQRLEQIRAELFECLPHLGNSDGRRIFHPKALQKLQGSDLLGFFTLVGKKMDIREMLGEQDYELLERLRRLSGTDGFARVAPDSSTVERAIRFMKTNERKIRVYAVNLYNSLSSHGKKDVDESDLFNAGCFGFFQSACRYHQEKMEDGILFHLRQAKRRMIDIVRERSPQGRRFAWFIRDIDTLETIHGPGNVTAEAYAEHKGIDVALARRQMERFFRQPKVRNFSALDDDDNDGRSFDSRFFASEDTDPEERLCLMDEAEERQEIFEAKLEEIRKMMSGREQEMLALWLKGGSVRDMMTRFQISEPRVSQLFTRIKRIVSDVFGISKDEVSQVFDREKAGFDENILDILGTYEKPITLEKLIRSMLEQGYMSFLAPSERRKRIIVGINCLRQAGHDIKKSQGEADILWELRAEEEPD